MEKRNNIINKYSPISNQETNRKTSNLSEMTLPSVGKHLQSHRKNKNLTLKNVSQHTKIGPTNLEFLEKDQLDKLPDRAYVIGYVKSYSKVLGINEKESLELLEKTYEHSKPRPIPVVVTADTSAQPKNPNRYKNNALIATFFLVIIIGLFFAFKLSKDSSPKIANTESKFEKIPLPKEKEIIVTPQTLSAESPLKPELPQPPQKIKEKITKENPETKTVEKEQDEKVKTKFYPLTKKLYGVDSGMGQVEINEFVPAKFRSANVQGKQNIYISAIKGNTWLTYKLDNKPIKQLVLEKGKGLFLRGDEARIFLGNLGAVKVFLNNEPLVLSSRTGVKNLVFPQENRNKYVMPLFIYNNNGTAQASDEYIKEKGIKLQFSLN